MKKIFIQIIALIWIIWINISNVFAIKLKIPTPSGQQDIVVNGSTTIQSTETELVDVINIVNDYLWFILAWLAFVIFVIAGIRLISWWNKDNMWKANKMLVSAVIAIVVSMLSYTIVKLLINLF